MSSAKYVLRIGDVTVAVFRDERGRRTLCVGGAGAEHGEGAPLWTSGEALALSAALETLATTLPAEPDPGGSTR